VDDDLDSIQVARERVKTEEIAAHQLDGRRRVFAARPRPA